MHFAAVAHEAANRDATAATRAIHDGVRKLVQDGQPCALLVRIHASFRQFDPIHRATVQPASWGKAILLKIDSQQAPSGATYVIEPAPVTSIFLDSTVNPRITTLLAVSAVSNLASTNRVYGP